MSLFQPAVPVMPLELVYQSVVHPTQYVVAISLAILLYDYSLTFCDEVNWIWPNITSKKPTLITVLFFLSRYFAILSAPVLMVQYFWESSDPSRIIALTSFHHATILISQGLMEAILIARTYALYNKNHYVLVFLCSMGAATVGCGVWGVIEAPSLAFRINEMPPRGCILPISRPSIETFMPAIILGTSVEILVFLLTLYRSIQVIRNENTVVIRILLRDGALYFGIVMVVNIMVIVSYYVFDDYSRGNIATLANSIASTLISRLILNLRDPMLSSDHRFRTPFHRPSPSEAQTADILTTIVSNYDTARSDFSSSFGEGFDIYDSWGSKDSKLSSKPWLQDPYPSSGIHSV